jgi:polysaccharide pyruvyl transferase WcaK-like protein
MTRGIYQGWTGWRNLGDEVMFQACQRELADIRWKAFSLRDSVPSTHSIAGAADSSLRRLQTFFWGQTAIFGGGTLINRTPAWLEQYRLLRRSIKRPVPVFSPGVANPMYWAKKKGWRDTRAEWKAALSDLPLIGVRGPLSKALLDDAGFRNVVVTGDPALSFRRSVAAPPVRNRVVAINAGRSNREMWGSEDRMISAISDAARGLTTRGFEVRIFPVWNLDEPVCYEVARNAGLPKDAVDPLILDGDQFLRYMDRFDVVVAVKLHAAVMAAAAGVPFVAVEYRPKVRDFTESIGWGSQTFRSDQVQGSALERAVQEVYDDRDEMVARMDSRVLELGERFRGYMHRVQELLLA